MILSEMSMDLPHYHNLEWRFDVQVTTDRVRGQKYLKSNVNDNEYCITDMN